MLLEVRIIAPGSSPIGRVGPTTDTNLTDMLGRARD
jgi:hypothetical protein